MKFAISSILTAALLSAGLSSCNEDPVQPPVPEPEGGIESVGDGSWDHPLSAYQVRVGFGNDSEQSYWVCGYIVGWIDTNASPTFSLETASQRFTAEGAGTSNLILAMTPDVAGPDPTNPPADAWKQCISVQLSGGEARNQLNLQNNPDMLGKQVCIYGSTIPYCGVNGVKFVSYYMEGDKGFKIDPPKVEEKNVTFVRVDDIDGPGEYLMVADGKYAAGPVANASYSYGYLPAAEVSVNGDKIVTSTYNAFEFIEAGGGWYIRDFYNRYLWWDNDPSHKSFQLDIRVSDYGAVWTVTPRSDGKVDIKNVDEGVMIQYASRFSNFSAYTNTSNAFPVLYKRESK